MIRHGNFRFSLGASRIRVGWEDFTLNSGVTLAKPGLEAQQMLNAGAREVVAKTSGKQVPWSNSSLLGEVFLAAKP